jgi:hypothetical protein
MKNIASLQTVVTLANAAELTAGIAKEVLGNDVADMVDGNELTTDVVRDIALAHIQSKLAIHTGSV